MLQWSSAEPLSGRREGSSHCVVKQSAEDVEEGRKELKRGAKADTTQLCEAPSICLFALDSTLISPPFISRLKICLCVGFLFLSQSELESGMNDQDKG